MGYHDDGRPHVIDFGKNIHNPLRRFRIQIACRFVGNEQERPVDDSSGNGYALLFTTTEIRRQGIGFAHQADQVENVADPFLDESSWRFDDFHGKGNIFLSRLVGKQTEILEHDTHAPAQIRDPAFFQLIDFDAIDDDRPFRRQFFMVEQFNERRLASTAGPYDKYELSFFNMHIGMIQSNGPIVVYFGYILEIYHRFPLFWQITLLSDILSIIYKEKRPSSHCSFERQPFRAAVCSSMTRNAR
jgi:hypothetical protein